LKTTIHRHAHTLAAVLLFGMGLLLVHAALTQSPTIDEPNHLTRGMAYLTTGESKLSYAHPPLANLLQAVPGALLGAPVDFTAANGWEEAEVERLARHYFRADYESARRALVAGRLVTAAITLLLGLYLYRFALRFGRLRAVLALALFALHPLFLAHGSLVTTDLPVTAAMFVSIGEFVRWVQSRSRLRFWTFALATGAAFATKFSALALVPMLACVGLAIAVGRGGPWGERPLGWRLLLLGRDFVLVALVSIVVVNASYSFQRTLWTVEETLAAPEPRNWITKKWKGNMLEELSALPDLPGWLPLPLPYTWVYGLHSIKAHNERGHVGWFLGEQEPSRLYFPIMAAIKTPAAILLLLLAGLGIALWRRARAGRVRFPAPAHLALWVAPLFLLGTSTFAEIQIGVRHVLPIFPFVALGAGHAATLLALRQPLALAGVLVLAAAETVGSAPRFLGHFSWAIGGSRVGHTISMVGEDWGQDVASLGELVRERGLLPLFYQPYGFQTPLELKRTGVPFRTWNCKTQLRAPAWVAIHAARLVRWRGEGCGAVRKDARPAFRVGEHIWVYRVEPAGEADEPVAAPARAVGGVPRVEPGRLPSVDPRRPPEAG